VSRVPIRIRVAGAFAVAMAVVLAGTGWFLPRRRFTGMPHSARRPPSSTATDPLLESQRSDRVEPRGASRRVVAEEEPHGERDEERQQDR